MFNIGLLEAVQFDVWTLWPMSLSMPSPLFTAIFVASLIAVAAIGFAQEPEPGKADLEARTCSRNCWRTGTLIPLETRLEMSPIFPSMKTGSPIA